MTAPKPGRNEPGAPATSEAGTSILDEIMAREPAGSRPRGPLVGEVVNARHPTLVGRVLVAWEGPGGRAERWLPTLHGLAVRAADRVLVVHPDNWPEPLVTGVIDGFARRPEAPRAAAAVLPLERDEKLEIHGADGSPLVEVFQTDSGPVVRLLQPDVEIEVEGALRISARRIALRAREGDMALEATGDVAVKGEKINLN